jgi:uridine kinase
MTDVEQVAELIGRQRGVVPCSQAVLVAISGIDGSGKGYIANKITTELRRQGVSVAALGTDSWQNPLSVRINRAQPAETFYQKWARLDELFELLILPLQRNRAVTVTVTQMRQPQEEFFPVTYDFKDVDVIVLEGAYLVKQPYRQHYHAAIWVDCTFETALERALQRNQEGLSDAEIRHDYATIYFPAQELHFARDNPKSHADVVLVNDPRLSV